MSQVRDRFLRSNLIPEIAEPAQIALKSSPGGKSFHIARLLRWYLLLWMGLIYLWGVFTIWNQGLMIAWAGCRAGRGDSELCKQLKIHLGSSLQPDPASLPPSVLLSILLPATLIFTASMLLLGLSTWFTLSGRRGWKVCLLFLALQSFITLGTGLIVPHVGAVAFLNLYLALTLEALAVIRQARFFSLIAAGQALLFGISLFILRSQWSISTGNLFSSVIVLIVCIVGFLFVVGFLLLYQQLARSHQQMVATYQALEEAHQQLSASSRRIGELTLLTERQRMARELHDTLAQGLVGLTLQLETVDALLSEETASASRQAQAIARQAMTRARATLADTRGAIDDLRSIAPGPSGLLDAIHEEIQHFTQATGISCSARIESLAHLPSALAEPVLRVIGEGLLNIARHAQAQTAEVQVSQEEQCWSLEIRDDGNGFDPATVAQQAGHYGLLGLRERARLLEGQLEILSTPGAGTSLRFSFPNAGGSAKASVPPARLSSKQKGDQSHNE